MAGTHYRIIWINMIPADVGEVRFYHILGSEATKQDAMIGWSLNVIFMAEQNGVSLCEFIQI